MSSREEYDGYCIGRTGGSLELAYPITAMDVSEDGSLVALSSSAAGKFFWFSRHEPRALYSVQVGDPSQLETVVLDRWSACRLAGHGCVVDLRSGETVQNIPALRGCTPAFSPDGRLLACSESLIDTRAYREIFRLDHPIRAGCFDERGDLLYTDGRFLHRCYPRKGLVKTYRRSREFEAETIIRMGPVERWAILAREGLLISQGEEYFQTYPFQDPDTWWEAVDVTYWQGGVVFMLASPEPTIARSHLKGIQLETGQVIKEEIMLEHRIQRLRTLEDGSLLLVGFDGCEVYWIEIPPSDLAGFREE